MFLHLLCMIQKLLVAQITDVYLWLTITKIFKHDFEQTVIKKWRVSKVTYLSASVKVWWKMLIFCHKSPPSGRCRRRRSTHPPTTLADGHGRPTGESSKSSRAWKTAGRSPWCRRPLGTSTTTWSTSRSTSRGNSGHRSPKVKSM